MTILEKDVILFITGCKNNDRQHQKSLYEWLKNDAIRICYRYTRNNAEVEDLVSEGFVKVFRNIGSFNLDATGKPIAHFKSWFNKVMVHSCIDWLRKQPDDVHLVPIEKACINLESTGTSGPDNLSYKEIIACIRLLSPAYRSVFNLYAIEGYSHAEIADMLEISVGSSKSNLSKARENLRKMIEQKRHLHHYA